MSQTSVTAYCPGHISGYFKRVVGADLASTGSIGAGIVISEGVTATISPSETTSICIRQHSPFRNNPVISDSSPPLSFVLERLGVNATVITECNLPIGAGFGLSAAALLSTLTAVNQLFGLDLSTHDIALSAHETEVIHKTGLGDVSACQGGGRVLRKGPGIDADIEREFDIREPLYAVSFGPIHTPSVLGSPDQMERVSTAFPRLYPESPAGFFNMSQQFAKDSGLMTDEVRKVLDICNEAGILSSMTMLGNGVFACGRNAKEVLSAFGNVYEFTVADRGARIIGER
ncbi:pantoate kinase [uncultured Methanoregula sp.]|uniref:pantoate kinase n=1 Tax=uncultured Methanoregula sp. TaxID=1005933 RepID=UPI002AAC2E78|nr:pantoate kinase [uncultured Methanoregula sp.]